MYVYLGYAGTHVNKVEVVLDDLVLQMPKNSC